MTPQQKSRLNILQGSIIYSATQLITFHKKHLIIIHQWRARNIIKSDADKSIIERWQHLAFIYDEAKKEATDFELELMSVRSYQKKEKEEYSAKQLAN